MESSSSELCHTIKPIFYLSKILGLAPISLERLAVSHGSILYSIALMIVFLYNEINMFRIIFGFNLLPKIGKILVFLEQIHFMSNMFISGAVAILRYKTLIDAIKGFNAVETLFKKLDVTIPHKSHSFYQALQIIGVLIVILITSALDLILNGLRIGFIFASTINIIVLTQFLDFVLLYRLYFSILNKQILNVNEQLKTGKRIYRVRYAFDANADSVNYESNTNFIANIGIPTNAHEYSLRIIRETHRFLYSLHDEVNSFYSIQLLCSVSSSILTIIAALYYYALYAISDLDLYYQHYWVGVINSAFTALYNFVKLLILVHICTTTTDEVSNTSVLVHSLMNNQETTTGLQNELHLFSSQLMHQKVIFTACGFFNLDFTLISTVIGAVSTYMIILIQFQITS